MSQNTHVKRLVRIGFKTEVISSAAVWLRKTQIRESKNYGLDQRPKTKSRADDYAYIRGHLNKER